MATALDVVKSFCYREGITLPNAISFESPTDPATLQLLHVLYAVVEELRRSKAWTQQKKVHTFEMEANRSKYPLPKDFYAPIPLTHYDNSDKWLLDGPMSDGNFAYRLYADTSGTRKAYRLFGPDFNPNTEGGQFWIDPADSTAGRDISFEYLSKNLFLPKHWQPSTAYVSGEYVNANGEIYLCDTNGTSHATNSPNGQTTNITDGTTQWDWVSTPYETIIDDNDINLFDDDVVKLGMRAKWFEGKGEQYESAKIEFEKAISLAASRFKGSYVGSMGGYTNEGPRYSVPPGSWS